MTPEDPRPVSASSASPRPRSRVLFRVLVTAALVIIVGGVIGVSLSSQRGAAAGLLSLVQQRPPSVVAIGDSIMDGHGLRSVSQAWPELVAAHEHWKLTNLSQDGAGFVQKGNAGTVFADQVREAIALKPSIVIISGSSNDLGISETQVEAAMDAAVAELHKGLPNAELIATTPVWNEKVSPPQLVQIDDAMRAAIHAAGGTSLDIGYPLLGHPSYMQSDDVHPNPQGQIAIADAVEAALAKAHLGG